MTITIRNGDKDIFLDMDDAQKYAPPNADDAGVIQENRLWTIDGFMKNADRVHIGDRIALPAFEVPAVKIGGAKVMAFKKQKIKDDAIIVDICDGKFVAVFDHCPFKSAMDLNSEKKFEQTQLGQYLQSEFLMAMKGAGSAPHRQHQGKPRELRQLRHRPPLQHRHDMQSAMQCRTGHQRRHGRMHSTVPQDLRGGSAEVRGLTMEIKGKVHCFFEQSGTFKNEFIKLGIPAEDYDIQNNFNETDHVIDLFGEITAAYNGGGIQCSIKYRQMI